MNMAALRTMAHELPTTEQPTLKDRITFVRYQYQHLTENIAFGFPDARNAVAGWMASPGHRTNILDRGVSETGIGIARARTGELYYCEVFGEPRRW
jgi:uncharacterized protein YkwD